MKNIKYIIYTAVCLITAGTISSCTKGFKELSVNPNTSEFALPQTLLAPAVTSVVNANVSRSMRINNELMQVHVNMGDSDGKIFRYDIRRTEADYMWNNWYLQLNNFRDIYRLADGLFKANKEASNQTYKGISLICEAWVMSMITDTYGDAPYSEASQARDRNFLPKFDKQEDIYKSLFIKLEEANELLKTPNADLPGDQTVADPIYQGSAAKWRKFGNSLYLRLLLRVSAKAEIAAATKIRDIVETNPANYPLIASNAESAILKFTSSVPYQSPFYNTRDADWYAPRLTQFFINNLKEWGDPRIAKWATLHEGAYEGVPGGYPVNTFPTGKSYMPLALKREALLGNIMNYAELQFILAEASVRGFISTNTKTYYDAGITNGITLWGLTVPANYLNSPDVVWDPANNFEGKMEQIHLQKYYALFFTDFEQWFEYRRTGHPVLPNGGGLVNDGKMPSRLNYPVYLQSANRDNHAAAVAIQGADDYNTKVWWQRP
jgi:hypothetical protein